MNKESDAKKLEEKMRQLKRIEEESSIRYGELVKEKCDEDFDEIDHDGYFDPELTFDDDKMQALEDEYNKVFDDIRDLLIDAKFRPKSGLITQYPYQLDEFTKDSFDMGGEAPVYRKLRSFLELEFYSTLTDCVNRLDCLRPYISSSKLHHHTLYLYHQITKCYVYGFFESRCVLSRALVESVAKRCIEHQGFGDLLVGKNKSNKMVTIPQIFLDNLKLERKVVKLFQRINATADDILHKQKKIDQERAEKVILEVREFLDALMMYAP